MANYMFVFIVASFALSSYAQNCPSGNPAKCRRIIEDEGPRSRREVINYRFVRNIGPNMQCTHVPRQQCRRRRSVDEPWGQWKKWEQSGGIKTRGRRSPQNTPPPICRGLGSLC